jgi:serine/threonine-protein kinase
LTAETLENGRYELGDRLGHGGMATVYLAEDTKLGRPVAIKLLADNLAHDDGFRERFMREARLAAQLDHPNVVKVFDVSGDEDRPFIVMELVDGGTLGDRLDQRRRMDANEAIELLVQGCRGLGHAHERKLVHRDVKPHNLLIRGADGCVKVADFGIARAAEDTRLTRTGSVIGTERYMAPEQLHGGRVSPATDVYSLGVVATELLGPERAPLLGSVVDRCLSEDPRQRYRDANELCDALSAVDDAADGAITTPIAARGPGRDVTAPTAAVPIPPGAKDPTVTRRARRGRARGWALAALALAAGVAVAAVLATSIGGDEGGDGGGRTTIPVVEGPAQNAPELAEPSQQAPALSDWIRANSE